MAKREEHKTKKRSGKKWNEKFHILILFLSSQLIKDELCTCDEWDKYESIIPAYDDSPGFNDWLSDWSDWATVFLCHKLSETRNTYM